MFLIILGFDLYSAEENIIPGRKHGIVKTDIAISIPKGSYARVAPRYIAQMFSLFIINIIFFFFMQAINYLHYLFCCFKTALFLQRLPIYFKIQFHIQFYIYIQPSFKHILGHIFI